MPKIVVLIMVLALMSGGCSGDYWKAKFHLFQAENAYWKGHELRTKKVPREERLKKYEHACNDFLKVYDLKPGLFTLFRIESAYDACTRVGNEGGKETFEIFRDRYVQEHPTEAEYGDAVPSLDA